MLERVPDALMGLAALSFGVSWVATGAARALAPRWGFLDKPDGERKSQTRAMPLLGGASLYLAFLIGCGAAWFGRLEWLTSDPRIAAVLPALIVSATLFCILGLVDDRRPLRVRHKLLWQFVAAVPFATFGRTIESVHFLGAALDVAGYGFVFTLLWIVACANAVNLIDGLDGLAATVGIIAMISVSTMTMMTGGNGATVLAVLLCGSLLGFLWHNRPPARIYLGDSGSLTIGFLIGALSIETALKGATGFLLAAPLLLMAVPFSDTLMAIVRRKLRGLGVGQADREHIHHCLQEQGLTPGQSLLVLTGISVLMSGAALAATYYKNDLIAIGTCLVVPAAFIAGRVFGHTETMLFAEKLKGIGVVLLDATGFGQDRRAAAADEDAEEPIRIPFEPNTPTEAIDPPDEQKRVA